MDKTFLNDLIEKTFSDELVGTRSKDIVTSNKGAYESTIAYVQLDGFKIEQDSFDILPDYLSFNVCATGYGGSQGIDYDGDIITEDIDVEVHINITITFPKNGIIAPSADYCLRVSNVTIKASAIWHDIIIDEIDDSVPEHIQEEYAEEQNNIDSASEDCKFIVNLDSDEDEIPF